MKITGSRIHRIWKCQASAVLRQFSDPDDAKFEPARGRGKAIHAFLQQAGKVERARLLADAEPELMPLLEALDLDNLPVGLSTEVSYAWHWVDGTARALGPLPLRSDGGVDYDHPSVQHPIDWEREIPCTLDVVGVANGGDLGLRGYVGDYKSGHVKYPAPDAFGQTLLGACCVAFVHGCDDVVVELIHIHDDGGHHAVRRIVNQWDLGMFAGELRDAMHVVAFQRKEELAIDGDFPVPAEGSWCDYCPAYRGCSAKLALVRAMPAELIQIGLTPATQGIVVFDPKALTVSNAGAAWTAIERIEDILGKAKAELCRLAWAEPIPLEGGRVLGRTVTETRKVNGKVAAELLERRYGRAERELRSEVRVTLAALRQAVVARIQPGEKIETLAGDGMYDRLLDELEREGGLETKVNEAVKNHVPKR